MNFITLLKKNILNPLLKKLEQEGLLDEETVNRINESERNKLFSVFWHLRTMLYLGVTLMSAGLGIIIYKNIDTIGHLTLVILTGLASAACIFYCFRKSLPFSNKKVESPGMGFDYMLLSGCLLFLVFLGYLQWQYEIFGSRYGLATFVPAITLLAFSYRFDHLGILTLGLSIFSSWLGITITPVEILTANDFSSVRIIYTRVGLGLLLGVSTWFHQSREIKSHFAFTYMNFVVHLACISCLAGLFTLDFKLVWFLLHVAVVFIIYRYAMAERSFYFLLAALVYGYIGVVYLFTTQVFMRLPEIVSVYMAFVFYIGSCFLIIRYLKEARKNMQINDPLS